MAEKLEIKEENIREVQMSPPNNADSEVEQLKNKIKCLEDKLLEIEHSMKSIVPNMTTINMALQRTAEISEEERPKKHALRRRNKTTQYSRESDHIQLPQFNDFEPVDNMHHVPCFCMMNGASTCSFGFKMCESALGSDSVHQPLNINHFNNSNGMQNQISYCSSRCAGRTGGYQQPCCLVPLLGQSGYKHPFCFGVADSSSNKDEIQQTNNMRLNQENRNTHSHNFTVPGPFNGTHIFNPSSFNSSIQPNVSNNIFSSSPFKSGIGNKFFSKAGISFLQTNDVSGSSTESRSARNPFAPGLFGGSQNALWGNSSQDLRDARNPNKFGSSLKTNIFQQPYSGSFSRKEGSVSIFGTPSKRPCLEESATYNSSHDSGSIQQTSLFGPLTTTDNPRHWFRVNKPNRSFSSSLHSFGSLWSNSTSLMTQTLSDDVPMLPVHSSADDGVQRKIWDGFPEDENPSRTSESSNTQLPNSKVTQSNHIPEITECPNTEEETSVIDSQKKTFTLKI